MVPGGRPARAWRGAPPARGHDPLRLFVLVRRGRRLAPGRLRRTGDLHRVVRDGVPRQPWDLATGPPAASPHPGAAPAPRGSGDPRRVFASWSDAGPRAHSVQATAPTTLVVSFVTEHRVVLDSVPPGLPLLVDGALSP